MAQPLKGKFGIVTGGSRNIGAAIATNLAAKGADLLLVYTSASSHDATVQICTELSSKHGIKCEHVRADLSNPSETVPSIITAAKHHFSKDGTTLKIDILINNAGVAGDKTLEEGIDPAQFDWMYKVNVLAPLLLTQACVPYLPHDRSGRIVNVSSVSSTCGFIGQSVYGGTKAALEAMTRTWARELGTRATVNAINPGPVFGPMYFAGGEPFWNSLQPWVDQTPLNPLPEEGSQEAKAMKEKMGEDNYLAVVEKMKGRRPAFTEEIAGSVGMLVLDDAGWTTGSVVCANGGFKMVS